jgi:hypothetical protein|tara:strand:- start:954 stop:1142 length:189 start_codon:yes stop_codon:yes gene_type:complete
MRVKFEIDSNNEVVNVDDDYDNTDISIEINEDGNKVVTILINRDLVLDGDERYMTPPIEEAE